ncbi:hypothetical protein [Clavibacter michiganensis]|uniref:hypothetical protein n=1 Tax=Clavibacter michiganensis TaxID=28447 RepID=UPI0011867B65|nr:hypothetical protein [Clavibacter michiganensis]
MATVLTLASREGCNGLRPVVLVRVRHDDFTAGDLASKRVRAAGVRAWFEQAKATTNGRRGLVVFLSYLFVLPVTLLVAEVALLTGATTLAGVSAVITFGLGLITVPIAAVAQGYHRAPDALSPTTAVVWHLTSQLWDVGDRIALEQRRCRLRSCMQRSDQPFALPRRAVFVFTADPADAHVRGNVTRSRARYLYRLDISDTYGQVFQRGIAVAIAGNVHATVSARRTLTATDVPTP